MYFRHLYATCQPSLEQRAASWGNYQSLFSVILHGNVNMQLPNGGWLTQRFYCELTTKLGNSAAREIILH